MNTQQTSNPELPRKSTMRAVIALTCFATIVFIIGVVGLVTGTHPLGIEGTLWDDVIAAFVGTAAGVGWIKISTDSIKVHREALEASKRRHPSYLSVVQDDAPHSEAA